jgi:SNF2 family DNA or RNA helicase
MRRIPFKTEEKPLYKKHWDEFIIGITEFFNKEKDSITMLAAISSLRRQCVHPLLGMDENGKTQKLALKEYIDNVHNKEHAVMPPSAKITRVFSDLMGILRSDVSNKVLVFSQWTGALNLIEYYLKRLDLNFLRLDGKTSKAQRQRQVDAFQTNAKDRIFLISIKAGGLGLNLTAANYVLLVDPYWNAAIESQAIDRANRMGQKRQVTVIRYLIEDEDSIEKAMEELQKNKLEHVNSVCDKDLRKTDLPELKLFLKHIKKKQEAARLARMPPKAKKIKR